ncbi:MAG: JDVT-CTERM system CAAX-type protease [Nitrospira sp.]|nr:JDVT-CTERM system CAAX-type protease [Nitrospira sp.]
MIPVSAVLSELLGRRPIRGFYRSPEFLCSLAVGAAFFGVLPLLVAVQPVPWQRMLSVAFLMAAVWQPIVEELLFRGCLQGVLASRAWGRRKVIWISAANLLTSIIFIGAHIPTHPLIWALLTLFPSLVFGILRDRSGSVVPPIVLHIFYNTGYFLIAGGSAIV